MQFRATCVKRPVCPDCLLPLARKGGDWFCNNCRKHVDYPIWKYEIAGQWWETIR